MDLLWSDWSGDLLAVAVVVATLVLGPPAPGRADGPPNLVMSPAYEEAQPKVSASPEPEKLQYEPMTDELPPLLKEQAQAETKNGAFYPSGEDLYFSLKPDFSVQSEKIDEIREIPPAASEKIPKPESSP